MKNKIILLLIFVASMNECVASSQKNTQLDSIIRVLKKVTRVEGERIGFAPVKSYVYQSAQYLWSITTIKQLVKLTDHKNPIIRCYAFLGLFEKKASDTLILTVSYKHENDKERIETFSGCLGGSFTVGFFMAMRATQCDVVLRKVFADSLHHKN